MLSLRSFMPWMHIHNKVAHEYLFAYPEPEEFIYAPSPHARLKRTWK